MTLQQLKYVVTVAENGTITNTAKNYIFPSPALPTRSTNLKRNEYRYFSENQQGYRPVTGR